MRVAEEREAAGEVAGVEVKEKRAVALVGPAVSVDLVFLVGDLRPVLSCQRIVLRFRL